MRWRCLSSPRSCPDISADSHTIDLFSSVTKRHGDGQAACCAITCHLCRKERAYDLPMHEKKPDTDSVVYHIIRYLV